MNPIHYYNRYTGATEKEQVYGEKFLKWTYSNPLGKLALHAMVKRASFSRYYGSRMNKASTKERIAPFIKQYQLDETEFLKSVDQFTSFNDFFFRKLKAHARPVSDEPVVLPADGRHLCFQNAHDIQGVFIKGQKFDIKELIKDEQLSERYVNGSLILSRLCPVDYHRFHFPVSGIASETRIINGDLFSVSPIALRNNLSYLWQNKRTITSIDTEHLGKVLFLEIGATCVGSIKQTYTAGNVQKGQEKGYFAFGGSSTITIFEPGKIKFAADLLENSAKQVETYALMGDYMATTI